MMQNGERVNHNRRFSKLMSGVLCALLVVADVSLIQMGRAIGELQVRYEDVAKNTQWIADTLSTAYQSERDQHQDSAIEELTRQYEEAARRLRIIERQMSNEGN